MSQPRLEITRRDGKVFAAYLYVNRDTLPDRVDRTWRCRSFGVDYTRGGRVFGIELFDPRPERMGELKVLLRELDLADVMDADLEALSEG